MTPFDVIRISVVFIALFVSSCDGEAAPTSDSQIEARNNLFQPRVKVVQKFPSMMINTGLSNPNGTAWCGGRPTYWITGHNHYRSPFCMNEKGRWIYNETVELDGSDKLNAADGTPGIDRHACVSMDVNKDGIEDIICSVGARQGQGVGYNELYLTQENGAIKKVVEKHGLYKHPYTRNRLAVTLRNKQGVEEYVFFGTVGGPRDDGEPNCK
jgi:hypothetical protein